MDQQSRKKKPLNFWILCSNENLLYYSFPRGKRPSKREDMATMQLAKVL